MCPSFVKRIFKPRNMDNWIIQSRLHYPIEIGYRIALVILNRIADYQSPIIRAIPQADAVLYSYPASQGEKVPFKPFFAGCIVLYFVLISCMWVKRYFVSGRKRRNLSDGFGTMALAFTLSVILALTIVDTVKLFVGRYRPDFFARCFDTNDMSLWPEDLTFITSCKVPKHFVEGRKSFPSGHSALAWSAFVILGLYVYEELSMHKQTIGSLSMALPLLFVIPPSIVAASRLTDHRHHATDILAGSIIGTLVSISVYLWYMRQFPWRPRSRKVSVFARDQSPLFSRDQNDEEARLIK
eukprot:GHVO01052226.1.p1 GENE.GHVO01052226.1~~GHVO01052226.1.p1  ORF type:complete len:297 (+),score=15.29 GHVO01052226.1:48-938(+)